jgi:hypothetical protein
MDRQRKHASMPIKERRESSLSACAEDRGLCPWMNAQNVAEYFTRGRIAASADFAVGG